MDLGTFSRRARSLATTCIFARVRLGTKKTTVSTALSVKTVVFLQLQVVIIHAAHFKQFALSAVLL